MKRAAADGRPWQACPSCLYPLKVQPTISQLRLALLQGHGIVSAGVITPPRSIFAVTNLNQCGYRRSYRLLTHHHSHTTFDSLLFQAFKRVAQGGHPIAAVQRLTAGGPQGERLQIGRCASVAAQRWKTRPGCWWWWQSSHPSCLAGAALRWASNKSRRRTATHCRSLSWPPPGVGGGVGGGLPALSRCRYCGHWCTGGAWQRQALRTHLGSRTRSAHGSDAALVHLHATYPDDWFGGKLRTRSPPVLAHCYSHLAEHCKGVSQQLIAVSGQD